MLNTPEIIKKEIRKAGDFIFALGYFSEIIMAIITIYVLKGDIVNVLVYIFFFLFSGFINTIFKSVLREPRPNNAVKYLYSEHLSHTKTIYGMPSGHSQNVFFSIMYLWLTTNESVYWLQIGLGMAALMVYERYTFHNHTLLQLFIGAIIGSVLGYIVVKIRDWIRAQYDKTNTNNSKKQQ
jgi:hypothetical protein